MYYKLVSRDNVESDILDAWPPILDPNFTLYNNSIIDITFPTEAQIFTWLESVSRLRVSNKQTNSQSSRNGDPNKIYAVYLLKPVPATQVGSNRAADTLPVTLPVTAPVYMYSVKMIRPGDPQLIIVSDTGERIKSSFKKYNVQKYCLTDRLNPNVENAILHSSEFRKVNQKYFEGIYPIGQELGIEQPNTQPNTPADREALSADYMGGDTSSMIAGSEINPDIFETRDIKHLVRGIKQSIQQTYDPYNTQNINHVDINPVYADYMEFVSAINTLDIEHNKFMAQHGIRAEQNNQRDQHNQRNANTTDLIDVGSDYGIDYREYDVVFADKSDKWLDNFITKLEKVEAYLRLLATGGKGRFNIRYNSTSKIAGAVQGQHEMRRSSLIIEINRILEANSDMTYETSEDFKKISNFVADPLLFDGDVYQVRFEDTLLIWHASYSQIIKEIRIVPSAQFCKYIAQFDLSDFFKQNQSIDILNKIYENLAVMYRSDKDQYNRNNPYGGSDIDYRGYGYQNNPNSVIVPIRVVKKEPALRKITRTF